MRKFISFFIQILKTKVFLLFVVLVLGFTLFSVQLIKQKTKDYVFSEVNMVPAVRVGIVLGTSNKRKGGEPNPYFYYRMQAAFRLYYAGKVKKLILSGDNSNQFYNEPKEMKKTLMQMGVPDSVLVLDYAGLRTFDSMIRAREVFGLDTLTVISQEFHNQRAVFIGRNNDITCYGFNAQDAEYQNKLPVQVREIFAKVKCVLDVYILHAKPKYLGKKENV